MSSPVYTFQLAFDVSANTVLVENASNGQKETLALPEGGVPYYLKVDADTTESAELAVEVVSADTFDPARALPCRILDIRAWVDESSFDTQDVARYVIELTNTSAYYVAEDLQINLELTDPDGGTVGQLPDGTSTIELVPTEQQICCIDPGATATFTTLAISRGTKPGTYHVRVDLKYRLLYWDGRDVTAQTSFDLDVASDFGPAGASCAATSSSSRAGSLTKSRRRPMANITFNTNINVPAHAKKPQLKPIEFEVALPMGGTLKGSYSLVKGRRGPSCEHCPCVFGVNEESQILESYFTTQDVATLKITLTNTGSLNLRHVNATRIEVLGAESEGCAPTVVDDVLPDGNLLFEVTPTDRYFGDIPARQSISKEFALVTRGIKDGQYWVDMDLNYDVEWCTVNMKLPVYVLPD